MMIITGDTHGRIDLEKLLRFTGEEGDYVVILGDFGLLWHDEPDEVEKYWTSWFDSRPWTTLFLDGNHENFNRINKLPSVDKFEGNVGQVSEKIYHLRRGQVYKINHAMCFVMGGGESIDKNRRILGKSWWPDELPSYAEMQNGIDNLALHDNCVDLILTHTCPLSIFKKLISIGQASDTSRYDFEFGLRTYLDNIKDKVKFKDWYFGHFHKDISEIDGRYHAVYNKLITIS